MILKEPVCEEKGSAEATAVFVNPGFGILTQEVTLPASHRLTHHAAVSAGCENGAVQEYWECGLCGRLFGNAAATWNLSAPAVGKPLGSRFLPLRGIMSMTMRIRTARGSPPVPRMAASSITARSAAQKR